MNKVIISTDQAPAAIGTYNQAVKVGTAVYLSGQIHSCLKQWKLFLKTLQNKHNRYSKI